MCIPTQKVDAQRGKANEDIEYIGDTKREEIQRYFGYELLLYRYLSLPYDVTVNTNQTSSFVDVGFLIILFLPILLLILLRRKKVAFFLFLFYLTFLWIISTSNSYVFSHAVAKVELRDGALNKYLNSVDFAQEPLDQIVGYIHNFSLLLYTPLKTIGEAISGDSDHVTYPIIFLLFVLVSYFLARYLKDSEVHSKFFYGFCWIYGLYWLIFSGGIIWYGYILIFVLYLLLFKLFSQPFIKEFFLSKVLWVLFIGLGIFWCTIASVDRISHIRRNIPEEHLGKGMLHLEFYDYAYQKVSKDQVLEQSAPNLGNALKKINNDIDSYVLRIGTSFTYFIEKNNERVFKDNQMGLFHPAYARYENKDELVDVFMASNFKYIIVDLNTTNIDNTPGKTLTKKYNQLMDFVSNNPRVQLIATDRVVSYNEDGQTKYYNALSGGKEAFPGSYAIFELI